VSAPQSSTRPPRDTSRIRRGACQCLSNLNRKNGASVTGPRTGEPRRGRSEVATGRLAGASGDRPSRGEVGAVAPTRGGVGGQRTSEVKGRFTEGGRQPTRPLPPSRRSRPERALSFQPGACARGPRDDLEGARPFARRCACRTDSRRATCPVASGCRGLSGTSR